MKICRSCKLEKGDVDFYGNLSYCKKCALEKYYKHRERNIVQMSRRNIEQYLPIEEYSQMLAEQNNLCKLCGRSPNGRWKKLCIDHDHDIGEVRGLICQNCNTAIGLLKDDSFLALKIYHYLKNKQPKIIYGKTNYNNNNNNNNNNNIAEEK